NTSVIYVQLWTHANGAWLTPQRYTYIPPASGGFAVAQISSPTPGTQLASTTMTFTWHSAAGAERYWLDVGTPLAQGNIYASGQTPAIPSSSTRLSSDLNTSVIYVQLWTHANGAWLAPQRYTYIPLASGA